MNYSKNNCPLIRNSVCEFPICFAFEQNCIKVDTRACEAAKYAYNLGFRMGYLTANEEMLQIQIQRSLDTSPGTIKGE